MKNLKSLKYLFYILSIVLLFVNCEIDSISELKQESKLLNEFPFKSSLLTKQDIETNVKLSNKIRSLATLQSSGLSENVYNSLYNFTVTTDVANFIESAENNSHSYTFPISRSGSTGTELENLVFNYNEAIDDYTASLVTYHFSETQKQEFFLTKHVSTAYNVSHESLSLQLSDILTETNLTTPCTTTYTVYHITPDTGGTFLYSTNGNIQNACDHEDDDDPCDTYTVIEIDCPDGGSSSANDSGTPTSGTASTTSTGGGNDSGSNSNNEDVVVTIPIVKASEEIERCLNAGFNDSAFIWLNSQSRDIIDEIHNFLQEVGCNETSKNFIRDAIEAIENGDVEDFHEFVMQNIKPDCESFNFSRVGTTNWQCASVAGVHELFTLFNWNCIGMEWGIFTQPLYFQLPINASFPQVPQGLAQMESAIRLQLGFEAFDQWYQQNGCSTSSSIMTTKLLDYIKAEFQEVGGTVTTTPPLGFIGIPTPYQRSWFGYGNCL